MLLRRDQRWWLLYMLSIVVLVWTIYFHFIVVDISSIYVVARKAKGKGRGHGGPRM